MEHFPLTQLSEQQSVLTAQALPELAHVVTADTQPEAGSHTPEQHSGPPWHASPTGRQEPAVPLAPAFGPPGLKPAKPSPPLPLSLPLGPVAAPPPLAPSDRPLVLPPQPTHSAADDMSKAAKIRAIRIASLREFFRAATTGLEQTRVLQSVWRPAQEVMNGSGNNFSQAFATHWA